MFTVDGMQWTFPCDIERTTEVTESEISGMLLNKNYFNDVIGTFLKYTITLVVPFGNEGKYTQLYEIITEPVDAHTFILPYNEGTITITGRVSNIADAYRRMANGATHWVGIKFDVISNAPTKTHELGDVISRGISPVPDISGAQEGDTYTWNGTGWIEYEDYEDADGKSF